jgi:hypothetical protein
MNLKQLIQDLISAARIDGMNEVEYYSSKCRGSEWDRSERDLEAAKQLLFKELGKAGIV